MKFFHKRSLREKVMFGLLLWVLVIAWAFYFLENTTTLRTGIKETTAASDYQQLWMDNEAAIDLRLQDALKRLDPSKALNRSQFIAKIDGIAREIGANYNVSSPKTRPAGIFDEHELSVSFQDSSLGDLIRFGQEIRKEPPNLFVQEVKITPNKRDPSKLRATFNIISVELKDYSGVPTISK